MLNLLLIQDKRKSAFIIECREKSAAFPSFSKGGVGVVCKSNNTYCSRDNYLYFSYLYKPPLPLLWKRRGKRRQTYTKKNSVSKNT